MPFKNLKQMKACYAMKNRGKNGSWDCDKWMKETKAAHPGWLKSHQKKHGK